MIFQQSWTFLWQPCGITSAPNSCCFSTIAQACTTCPSSLGLSKNDLALLAAELGDGSLLENWLVDSGASAHVTPILANFDGSLKPTHEAIEVTDGQLLPCGQKGTVAIKAQNLNHPNSVMVVKLTNVLHIPGSNKHSFSVDKMLEAGHKVTFSNQGSFLALASSTKD